MEKPLTIEQATGQKLFLAFIGKEKLSREILEAIEKYKPGGITFFRSLNIDHPHQVRQLSGSLQDAARQAGLPPLLIAADQEGGQLMAIGNGTTPLPGNMALGAAGSTDLARGAGEVLGRELSAMGINVNYAPCCDVNINPQNPVIGIRSFGEDPQAVAQLAAAMVAGLQSSGVAATAKHFPGHGDTASDSHLGLPSVPHAIERLRNVEFPPFRAAIQAGAKLVMTAHLALPALDGPQAPPATLSAAILKNLLRGELGFGGLIITDAMDMHAIAQGEALGENAVRAVQAGADLLLMAADPADHSRVHKSLSQAVQNGTLKRAEVIASAERILSLKRWLADQPSAPDPGVIGCAEHQKVAAEISARSITLVRDRAGWLPLRLKVGGRMAVVLPSPRDLTPADTSSYVAPTLAQALRSYHPDVDEFLIPFAPSEQEIAGLLGQLRNYNLIILGTLNAFQQPGQAALVREALKMGIRTVVAALRLPYDLAAFPEAPTYLCTYSILEPSMRALSAAIFGRASFRGRLPVSIPGLYAAGHGQAL